jgi:hypothetical protein
VRSYDNLDNLISECPESVALFTDDELAEYGERILPPVDGFDRLIVSCLIGEMLVRGWLYNEPPQRIHACLKNVNGTLKTGQLLVFLHSEQMRRLRGENWSSQVEQLIENVFSGDICDCDQEEILTFVKERITAFLKCDGVIPVAIGGDAVAVPFEIDYNRFDGKILDSNGEAIDGWISNSTELWKEFGSGLGIDIGCVFGRHPAEGGSFALPVLYGATRDRNEPRERHPLAIVCTGEFENGHITQIDSDGRDRKQQLATRLGAEQFFGPGIGSNWPVQIGMQPRAAITVIYDKLGEESSRRVARLDRVGLPFSREIRELTAGFRGREDQLRRVLEWIEGKVKDTSAPAMLWISGRAGSGKSAFMGALSQECLKRGDLQTVRYFFGETYRKKELDFLESAAQQIAALSGDDKGSLKGKAEDQFRSAVAARAPSPTAADEERSERRPRLIFIVDGVNQAESKGPLSALADAATTAKDCIWIFAGQAIPKTGVIQNLPGLESLPGVLEGLRGETIRAWVNSAAPDLSEEMREAIISRSGGLPLYTKYMLNKWERKKRKNEPLTLADISQNASEDFREYYESFIEDMRVGPMAEQSWREPLPWILALLATAREGIPLTARTLHFALAQRFPMSQESHIETALSACVPVLRLIEHTAEDEEALRRWTITHDSLRAFFNGESSPVQEYTEWARKRWREICELWDQDIEVGARRYALRYLFDESLDDGAKRRADVIQLGRNSPFLDAQSQFLGPKFPLETMRRALVIALETNKLPDAAALTLDRARRAQESYMQSPFDAMRTAKPAKDQRWTLELIERMENQDERTLWQMAVAAYHANGNRPQSAAEVLDAIPRMALQEKLPLGASTCAVALLFLLMHVRTQRFHWDWFITRLDDFAKQQLIPLLVFHNEIPLAIIWKALQSIENPASANKARGNVIRELSRIDADAAELQLQSFDRKDRKFIQKRAFAAVHVISAFAQDARWADADRVVSKYCGTNLPRQHAKALGYLAVCQRKAGRYAQANRDFEGALDTIEKGLARSRDQQADAYAEFGQVQVEAGFFEIAEGYFNNALGIAQDLTGSRIYKATCFTSIASSLAATLVHTDKYYPMLEEAVQKALYWLSRSDEPTVNEKRLKLCRALGRANCFSLAKTVFDTIPKDDKHRIEAGAWLVAYSCRHNTGFIDWLPKAPFEREDRLLFCGIVGIELADSQRGESLRQVCWGLRRPQNYRGGEGWGPARILGAAAIAFAHHNDIKRSTDAIVGAEKRLKEKGAYRGRHLINLAESEAECAQFDNARKRIEKLRASSKNVDALAEAERVLLQFNLIDKDTFATDGVYNLNVASIKNDKANLLRKLELSCTLISPFAEAKRFEELDTLCSVSAELLRREQNGLLIPQRRQLAAKFSAKLAKSALQNPNCKEWAKKFLQQSLELSKAEHVPNEPDATRAQTLLMMAEGQVDSAIREAQRIGDGENRGIVIRDLAIRFVQAGQSERARHLSSQITNGRSQHLPDIAREVARYRRSEDRGVLHELVADSSEYSDAAHRVVSSLIIFHRPGAKSLTELLDACGFSQELPERSEPAAA